MAATKVHHGLFKGFHHGTPAEALDDAERAARRRRRAERIIVLCWVLIAVKSVAVGWAVEHYRIPFSPMWVIGPTVAFAALATAVYYLFRD